MGRSRLALVLGATVVAFFSLAASSWAQTVTKTNSTAARADGSSVERSVSFGAADFPAGSTVNNVVITLDFAHIDDTGDETNPTCGPPPVNGTLNERNDELGYDLRSPTGTTVSLIGFATYTASGFGGRVSVTLDDTAASALSGVPTSGTFRPSQPLSGFDGELANGTWTLVAKDSGGGDPLCHYGFSLTLTVDPPPNRAPVASNDAYSTAEEEPCQGSPAGRPQQEEPDKRQDYSHTWDEQGQTLQALATKFGRREIRAHEPARHRVGADPEEFWAEEHSEPALHTTISWSEKSGGLSDVCPLIWPHGCLHPPNFAVMLILHSVTLGGSINHGKDTAIELHLYHVEGRS